MFGVMRQHNVQMSSELAARACYCCGTVFVPNATCDVAVVPKRGAGDMDLGVCMHAEALVPGGNDRLERCCNWVVYRCRQCARSIAFRGTVRKSLLEQERQQGAAKREGRAAQPKAPDRKLAALKKMGLLGPPEKREWSLEDFARR